MASTGSSGTSSEVGRVRDQVLDQVLDYPAILEALAGLHPERALLVIDGSPRDPAITGASLDSRTLRPGDLFVALPGVHAHGASFVTAALAAGAALAVVARRDQGLISAGADRSRILWVDDAAAALTALGRASRLGHRHLHVVAVTGSYGKTTTKEMIAAALGSSLRVHRTPGNFNNHLGVPITLLGLTSRHQAAVVELGMNAPGEIGALAALAAPQIGVVTGIGRAHLAGLGSREAIIAAKLELTDVLGPKGLLFIPATDPDLVAAARRKGTPLRTVSAGRPASGETADLLADQVHLDAGAGSVRFRVHGLGLTGLEVELATPARILVTPALFALGVGAHLGLEGAAMTRALAAVSLPDRRLALKRAGGVLILDDCYNANPESMAAALSTLAELGAGRRVAVLGDMRELGPHAESAHRELGERAAEVLDRLFVIGEHGATVARAARAAGMAAAAVTEARDRDELIRQVLSQLRSGDGLLVKASRALGLEAVVEAVLRARAPGAGEGRKG